MTKKYDYLIVGSGLFGSVFAYNAKQKGKKCLIIEKRSHIAGNVYTENIDNINVHKYGAHIFHTDNKKVWDFVSKFATFNRYTNSPISVYKDEVFNLPFNMNTFNQMWGVKTPNEAKEMIEKQVKESGIMDPQNLEEQAISLVGKDIYTKLIKGYTQKQWGKSAKELPTFIIKRLPVRFTYDNNYFNDNYQGIPIGGYTRIVEKMLEGIDLRLNTNFYEHREELLGESEKVLFTGMIDEYYDYKFGTLEYRSLKFENEKFDIDNYQGNAVVNYNEYKIPYTRIIEHKHFEKTDNDKTTIITKEYPMDWTIGDEPYYPVNDVKNSKLYLKYKQLADAEESVVFGGRLSEYRYYDMDDVIYSALDLSDNLLK